MKRLTLLLTLLTTTLLSATVAAALDEITLVNRPIQKGTVIAMSPTGVTLNASGNRLTLPVNEITGISYDREPIALRSARRAARARQYDAALQRLATITPASVSRDLIVQDIAYLQAYAAAKIAMSGKGDKNQAMWMLTSFVAQYKTSYHQFAANEALGDLAVANRQYDTAAGYYRTLAQAPWPSYRLHATVLEARSLQAQKRYDEALKAYDQVIAASKETPGAEKEQALATIGKMACLIATNRYPDKAQIPNAELHVWDYSPTWTDGCCWDFTIYQHWGAPGNIMYVDAQVAPSTVTVINANGPTGGAQAAIVTSPNAVRWYMPLPDGLWNANATPLIVTVCFKDLSATGATLTLTGYDSAGNTALPLQQTSVTFGEFGECEHMPDLWMKDTMTPDLPEDFGVEPNTVSLWSWISRDIWVRPIPDTPGSSSNPGPDTIAPADRNYVNDHQHLNPVYVNPTTPSYVYVKVRNRGSAAGLGSSMLRVYWADASTGLNWPGSFAMNEIDCVPGPGVDPCLLPPIAPGQDYVAELRWVPPDPLLLGNRHFCLLARIETDPFGTFGMTFPESTFLWQNVPNNNNIVQKNITVLSPQANTAGSGNVIVRNPLDHAVPLTLRFTVPSREATNHFLRYGDITIDLGDALMQKWRESGQRAQGFEVVGKTTIKITDPTNAQLSGLRFNAAEEHRIEVRMQLRRGVRLPIGTTFTWDVTELAPLTKDARPRAIGGERYIFTVPKTRQPQANPE